MKSWVLSIIVVVVSISIISLIFPSGKLGKFIKSVFAFVLTVVILKPVTGLKHKDFDINFDDYNASFQTEYLEYVNNIKVNKIVKDCELIAEKYGAKNVVVELDCLNLKDIEFKVLKVVLNFKNSVINSDKEHIVIIESIKREIAEYLGIDYSQMVIYG